MQMCPECDRLYDESEYSVCPYCNRSVFNNQEVRNIVYDKDKGEALELTDSEYEEFKKSHPGYL